MRKRITKALLDGLKPDPEGDLLIWDDRLIGFGVRVSRGGSKSFVFQFSEGGQRRRRITLGSYGAGLTLAQAQKLAGKRRGEVSEGRNPARERRQAIEAPTVADLCGRMLEEHFTKKSVSSRRNAEMLYRLYLLPALGSRRVSEVRWEDVAKLHADLSDRPYQANRLLAAASIAWRFAARWGWWPREMPNPAGDHDKHQERHDRGLALSAEQLARVGEALRQEAPGSIAAAAFTFCLLTGCRPAEALAARWEDIDLAGRRWQLPASKTGRRTLYLGEAAVAVLRQQRRTGPLVFPSPRGQGRMFDLKAVWCRLKARAELPAGFRAYDGLRHTFISWGEQLGVERSELMKLSGHSPGGAAHDRYRHGERHLLAAADLVSSELARLLGG